MPSKRGILRLFAAAVLVLAAMLLTGSAAAQPRKGHTCPPKMSRCPLNLGKPHAVVPGVNDDWHVRPGELGDVSRIGGQLIRFPFVWATVQPDGPNAWDWTAYDRIFDAARAHGLQVILEPGVAPCWAHLQTPCPPGLTPPEPPDALHEREWQDFIRRALERYDNIVAVEVWNEPNISSFWLGGPDPARYAAVLQATYTVVKSVRPSLPVLFGGVAAFTPNAPLETGYIDFLRKAYAAGAGGYFDALALHPYPVPYNRPDYRERVLGVIARARAVARRAQHITIPIWITEVGLTTAGPGAVSEKAQAVRFGALYKLLARVPRLPVVVLHRYFDQPGAGNPENGFGVVRPDLSEKPAYAVTRWDFTHFAARQGPHRAGGHKLLPGAPP